jgi:predicted DNA-binding ribbon-helix-helix protein
VAAPSGAPPLRRSRRRRLVPLAGAAAALLASLALSACGNDGLTLARQACGYVNTSLKLYTEATHDANPTRAAAQQHQATVQLERAQQIASQANSADPQWNPLMTTLQEVGRNSEGNLVAALRAQCAQAAQPDEEAPIVSPQPSGSVATGTPTRSSPSTLPGQ